MCCSSNFHLEHTQGVSLACVSLLSAPRPPLVPWELWSHTGTQSPGARGAAVFKQRGQGAGSDALPLCTLGHRCPRDQSPSQKVPEESDPHELNNDLVNTTPCIGLLSGHHCPSSLPSVHLPRKLPAPNPCSGSDVYLTNMSNKTKPETVSMYVLYFKSLGGSQLQHRTDSL